MTMFQVEQRDWMRYVSSQNPISSCLREICKKSPGYKTVLAWSHPSQMFLSWSAVPSTPTLQEHGTVALTDKMKSPFNARLSKLVPSVLTPFTSITPITATYSLSSSVMHKGDLRSRAGPRLSQQHLLWHSHSADCSQLCYSLAILPDQNKRRSL